MKIERGYGHSIYPYVCVHVGSDELQCDARKLPYPACIGVIRLDTFKATHWTPAASVPRGYVKAAKRVLERVAAGLKRTESAFHDPEAITPNYAAWFEAVRFASMDALKG